MKFATAVLLAAFCRVYQHIPAVTGTSLHPRLSRKQQRASSHGERHLYLTEEEQKDLDAARGNVEKKVVEGSDELQKLKDAVEKEKQAHEELEAKKMAHHQALVSSVIASWEKHSEAANNYCEDLVQKMDNHADEKCRIKKEKVITDRDTALKDLKATLSAEFSADMSHHVADLTNLVLMGDGKKIKIQEKLDYTTEVRHQYVELDPLFLDDEEKGLEYYLACADEIVTDVSGEIERIKKILFGDVCLEFVGVDKKVSPVDEPKFNENFAAALELSYAAEGMDVDVMGISILEQHVFKDSTPKQKGTRHLKRSKKNRSLRMKVGASYQCNCDTGNDTLQSDVWNRRSLFDRELWNSDVAENFGKTLTASLETVFEDLLYAEAFDCAELESRFEEDKKKRQEAMKKIGSDFVDKVDDTIKHARDDVEEFKKNFLEYQETFEIKRQDEVAVVRKKTAEVLEKWNDEMVGVRELCQKKREEGKSENECIKKTKEAIDKKNSDIHKYRQELAEKVRIEIDTCTEKLTEIGLDGHVLLTTLNSWLEYGLTVKTEFESEIKDLKYQISVLKELLRDIIKTTSMARSIHYGDLCLEFTGVKHMVHSEKKDQLEDRCAVGLEFAFIAEGADVNIFQVEVLNQNLTGSRRHRNLQNRLLRKGNSQKVATAGQHPRQLGHGDVLQMKLSTTYELAFGGGSNLNAGEEPPDLFEVMGEDFAHMIRQSFHAVFDDIVSVEPVSCSSLQFP